MYDNKFAQFGATVYLAGIQLSWNVFDGLKAKSEQEKYIKQNSPKHKPKSLHKSVSKASGTPSNNDEGAMALRMDGLKADFDVTQTGERWFFVPGRSSGTLDAAIVLSYRGEGQAN